MKKSETSCKVEQEEQKFKPLTEQEIRELCEEIDVQWEYHLMTRSIFHSKFPKIQTYSTFGFYRSIGRIDVTLPPTEERTEVFKRASKGIGYWHNQNYAIRLFGIVNASGIMKRGKTTGEKIIILLDNIRNNVGAHSSGRNISRPVAFKEAIELINELFGTSFDPDKEGSYPLAIDKVLEKLKKRVVDYINSLKENGK